MFCTKCGAKIEDGAKFCTSCGQRLEESPAPAPATPAPAAAPAADVPAAEPTPAAAPAEKKDTVGELVIKAKALLATFVEKAKPVLKKVDDKAKSVLGDKKNYAYAGVLVLIGLIITVSVIAAIIPDGNGYLTYDAAVEVVSHDDIVYIIKEGKLIKIKTDAEGVSNFKTSIDGKVTVFKYDGELYAVKGNKAKAFAEEVKDYTLSLYGDSVVYTVVDELETTYYYAKVGGKSVEIFTNEIDLLDGKLLGSYVISPDGKSVAYTVTEGLETDLYYFSGKKSEKVAGCDGKVVGMSNGGKYIYAAVIDEDLSAKLFVYNKNGKREKIDSCSNSFALNLDGTEILFHNDGKTYISVKGKEAVKVAGAEVTLLRPRYTNTYNSGSSAIIYPVDTLYDHVYTANTTAYYVAKKESKNVKLVNADSTRINLDSSAQFLYYFDDETLMCLEVAKGENAKAKAKEIAEDVDNFVLTLDRKYLYYVSDDELFVVNGKKGGKPKTIEGEDVSTKMTISRDDVLYYYCEDAVYATKGKSKGKAIIEDADFQNLGGYVYLADEDAIYSARGKSKPKKLLEND